MGKEGGQHCSSCPSLLSFSLFFCYSSAWSTSHHAHPLDHHIKNDFHLNYRNCKQERNKSYKNVWITIYCSLQVCLVKLYKSKVERQIFSNKEVALSICSHSMDAAYMSFCLRYFLIFYSLDPSTMPASATKNLGGSTFHKGVGRLG